MGSRVMGIRVSSLGRGLVGGGLGGGVEGGKKGVERERGWWGVFSFGKDQNVLYALL